MKLRDTAHCRQRLGPPQKVAVYGLGGRLERKIQSAAMTDLSEVMNAIYGECHDDYVGLWSIVREIRETTNLEGGELVRASLHVLGQLLSQGGIVAGEFEGDRFHVWNLKPEEVVARVELEWRALGRDPDIGEIVWFTAAEGLGLPNGSG
jgi:hypothetical protein